MKKYILKYKFRSVIFLTLVFASVFFISEYAGAANTNVWFESATTKIRQDATVKNQPTLQIKSAKNEFEPFQLALKSDQTLNQLDVEITDFTGTGGSISSGNVTIFLEKYMNVTQASTIEGQTGEWPDALCPKVDAYYHEKRNCFPFGLTANRIQPIWFDVFVPKSTAAGNYSATVNVTAQGQSIFQGSVTLTVWNFTLPDTSSLESNFVSDWNGIWQGHYGGTWPPGSFATLVELQRLYIKAGLRHRLTFTPISFMMTGWNGTDYTTITDTYFHQTLQGFLGDGDPGVEYGNSKMTSIWGGYTSFYFNHVNCAAGYTEPPQSLIDQTKRTAEIYVSKLTPYEKAIFSVLPIDEPGAGGDYGKCSYANPLLDYNSAKAMADETRKVGLKTHITSSRKTALLNASNTPPSNDYWNTWISPFNNIVGHDWNWVFYNRRSDYDIDIANGAGLWWYTACGTHGCAAATGGTAYNGYPQYSVDYQGIYTRIFPWMAFKYDIQGEELWAVVSLYTKDPWGTLWSTVFGGNGDGNFLYPGVPDAAAAGFPYTYIYNNVTYWRGNSTPSI